MIDARDGCVEWMNSCIYQILELTTISNYDAYCYSIFYTSIIISDGDNEKASTCDETLLQALDDLSNQDAFNPSIDNLNQPKSSYKLFYSNNNNGISTTTTTTAFSGSNNEDSRSSSGNSGKKKSKSRSSSITSFTNSLSTGSFFNNRSKEREAAILETLEIAQQRIVHLVIELDNAKEANAIVLETKESVLRSLARQNTILTIEVSIDSSSGGC